MVKLIDCLEPRKIKEAIRKELRKARDYAKRREEHPRELWDEESRGTSEMDI